MNAAGLRLQRLGERTGGERIACRLGWVGVLGGNDIEEDDGNARIGTVGGNPAPHHAGAEHCDATDRSSS
jgi:hypothetical protein